MKLRILGDTIRVRVSKSEVEKIARGEVVEEVTAMLPKSLWYRLEVSEAVREIGVSFNGEVVRVVVPAEMGKVWAMGGEVGMVGNVRGAGSSVVRVTIEKDFKCLHGSSEEQADCYPNPREGESR